MLIPDSPTYIHSAINGHPLAQAYFTYVPELVGMDGALAFQILFCCVCVACFMVRALKTVNGWAHLLIVPVLLVPVVMWGPEVGSDALGYGFFLIALSTIDSPKVFITAVILASLARFQYVALFVGLLWMPYWRCVGLAIIVAIACIFITEWRGSLGMYGRLRKTTEYLSCAAKNKPEHISHAEYFNMSWGGHLYDSQPGCAKTDIELNSNLGVLYNNRSTLYQLIKSKLRYTFNPLGLPAILLCCIISPSITILCLCLLLFVAVFSTPLYMQYTAMVSVVLLALAIKRLVEALPE